MIDLNKKFLIYGYGISGKSIEKYLKNKKCNYEIFDDFQNLKNLKYINKELLLKNLNNYDYFIVSPSIKIHSNHFLHKYRNKIIIDLDFLSIELKDQRVIGVTGTEGKSSTCYLIKEILQKKYHVKIIGNFGNTILDSKELKKSLSNIDFLIIELSSYQLDKIKYLKLHYALITNIYSDHLEYHNNIKNYVKSKFRIQTLLYVNSFLYVSKDLYLKFKNFISIHKKNIVISKINTLKSRDLINQIKYINLSSIKYLIKDIDKKINLQSSLNIPPLKYRNQLVFNKNDLKIYNDSKCTNLYNAIYKNNLINNKKKILILGGKLKKQKSSKFIISDTLVLIFGDYTPSFLKFLKFNNSNFYTFPNLNKLFTFLRLVIKANKYNFILFSPGGESFDAYNDYKHRGKQFNNLLKKVL